jgi:hypothetical protein
MKWGISRVVHRFERRTSFQTAQTDNLVIITATQPD